VVRRLRPDIQREMTPQKTEWWHQAQAACEAGDVEQMEVILTLGEIGDIQSASPSLRLAMPAGRFTRPTRKMPKFRSHL